MNLSIMLLLHDVLAPSGDRGPGTPRPTDPSPEGGEGEPVGDDDGAAGDDDDARDAHDVH